MKHMKKLKIFSLTLGVILAVVTSCKDNSLQIVPDWESSVHGLGAFAEGSAQNFVFADPSVSLDLTLRWVSIDNRATVEKMEVYAVFTESYTDPDGLPATADHGGDQGGVLLATYEGANVPDNALDIAFNLTQDIIYQLYKDNTFDYDKDDLTAPTPVFNNPDKPDRSPTNPFVQGDAFQIRWEFTTTDGRLFSDWSPSVCNEFPGASCTIDWGVICVSNLAGTYDVVSTFDSPGYFDSVNPDFQYGPGNDGSVANGVQTYNNIPIVASTATATYLILDITNGFEPIMWGNPPVEAIVADQCGAIVAVSIDFAPYGYEILPASKVNPDGSITISWLNVFGENGISTFTPQ